MLSITVPIIALTQPLMDNIQNKCISKLLLRFIQWSVSIQIREAMRRKNVGPHLQSSFYCNYFFGGEKLFFFYTWKHFIFANISAATYSFRKASLRIPGMKRLVLAQTLGIFKSDKMTGPTNIFHAAYLHHKCFMFGSKNVFLHKMHLMCLH